MDSVPVKTPRRSSSKLGTGEGRRVRSRPVPIPGCVVAPCEPLRRPTAVPGLGRVVTPRYKPTDSNEHDTLRTRYVAPSTRNVASRGRVTDARFPPFGGSGPLITVGRSLSADQGEFRNPPRGGQFLDRARRASPGTHVASGMGGTGRRCPAKEDK